MNRGLGHTSLRRLLRLKGSFFFSFHMAGSMGFRVAFSMFLVFVANSALGVLQKVGRRVHDISPT